MNNEELRAALLSGEPVQCRDSTYKCVSAIIYRNGGKGSVYIQAELTDKNGNSVTIAAADKVVKAVQQ